jgi:hypothetical protein
MDEFQSLDDDARITLSLVREHLQGIDVDSLGHPHRLPTDGAGNMGTWWIRGDEEIDKDDNAVKEGGN